MTDQPTPDDAPQPDADTAAATDTGPAPDTGAPDRPQPTGAEDDGRRDRTPGAALAEIAGAPSLPPPPKRTGVFLDPDDLREHVGALLRTFLGGYQVDAWGNFTFTHEDARVFVTVGASPIGPQVGVFSVTNLDVELSPQLGGFLLTTNHKLGFGSFSFDPDNDAVWLRHTLLGTTLDGPELQSAVAAVASTAAHFDDIIRDRFGGRAFADAPRDVQDATKPPDPTSDGGDPSGGHPNASGYL
ncbi:MAG: hypothetical protein KY457_02025 [Actinobacteria bacterium]|nr:hypothetical protein [Actinomycetota bacterium]